MNSPHSSVRRWGWANGTNCAFRDADGHAVYPILDWRNLPRCPDLPTYLPKSNIASQDSYGQLWGWANDTNCAFRDANGLPIQP